MKKCTNINKIVFFIMELCFSIISFAQSGKYDSSFHPSSINGDIRTLAVGPDGSIYVGGFFGTIDGKVAQNLASFSSDGKFKQFFDVGTGPTNTVQSISVCNSEIIVTGKFQRIKQINYSRVAIFDSHGKLLVNSVGARGGANNDVYATCTNTGNIGYYLGGKFTSYNGKDRGKFVSITSSGEINDAFNPDFSVSGEVYAICNLRGSLYIGGMFGGAATDKRNKVPSKSIVRVSSNGYSIDRKFSKNGPMNGKIYKILETENGLLVVGSFSQYSSDGIGNIKVPAIVKISKYDGVLDKTFNLKPMDIIGKVTDVLVHPKDGKIVIVGTFTRVHNKTCNRIARLNPDGSLDTTFDSTIGADGNIATIALSDDGNLIIGGDFNTYDNVKCDGFAKVIY